MSFSLSRYSASPRSVSIFLGNGASSRIHRARQGRGIVETTRGVAFGRCVCCVSETSSRKLISSSDIPLLFPRTDFTTQLFRWAKIEAESEGLQNFGAVIEVTPFFKNPDAADEDLEMWGFDGRILKDGVSVCHLGVYLDREVAEKSEFVGIGEDRFPVNEGRVFLIEGKALQIWKMGDDPVDEDIRNIIRRFCEALASAIDTYAAFGSCFVDDTS